MPHLFESKDSFKESFKDAVSDAYGRDFEDTYPEERYIVLGNMIRDFAGEHWRETKNAIKKTESKQLYYFSMEFLMGRLMTSNLMNLNIYDVVKDGLKDLGMDINEMENIESDAGLGNGGLGRLAACFMDSLASLDLPGHGNCIRYRYGLFKQKIENNQQVELPDCWLKNGNVWEVWKPQHAVKVKFGGYVDGYMDGYGKFHAQHHPEFVVRAVPYDEPIVGYHTTTTNTLRLWDAEVDEDSVNSGGLNEYLNQVTAITANVYPDDSTIEGKRLRLTQEYFFVCAGIDQIIRSHLRVYPSLDNLGDKVAIQLNDTHPVLVIPELMRVLLDDYFYDWDDAWNIVTKTVACTNHTVMAEALETWDVDLMQRILPRIYAIIVEINNRYCAHLTEVTGGDSEKVTRMSIILDNRVKMANLCCAASSSVNGVSKLHSEIIKDSVFHDQYTVTPDAFKNVTNGIAYRRWLLASNQGLTNLHTECIGDGFKKDASKLADFKKFATDKSVLDKLAAVKLANKQAFAKYVYNTTGTKLNCNGIFDVQVKRLHEYKRQQLNAMNIIADYIYLLNNPDADFVPKTYIFASKAAPGYYMAKQIIKMIWCIGEELKKNPKLNEKLAVVFLEDYKVTLSEILMPASEISEQISLAGTEASGTGNMKLMLNGALTMGTYDGANVEIHEAVGDDNIFIFGMSTPEVNQLKAEGYDPEKIYNSHAVIKSVLEKMYKGINGATFEEVANSLRHADRYMCFADFDSYRGTQAKASETYKDKYLWNKMSLINIASAGIFSADRAVTDYARDIWKLI